MRALRDTRRKKHQATRSAARSPAALKELYAPEFLGRFWEVRSNGGRAVRLQYIVNSGTRTAQKPFQENV